MGLTLPADVVLNVVRPTQVAAIAAAAEKRAASSTGANASAFAQETAAQQVRAATNADSTPDAFRKFEAMMLQSFLQSMLPSESEAVYGEGLAGDMWRSMLAEQVASVMAERGGIGVADRILAGHYNRTIDQPAADQVAAIRSDF